MTGAIHPTAVIAPDAVLADGVEVGPFSVIGPGVEIGRGTRVGPHVVIEGPTRIGAGNRIFQFASVGADPQDKKYRGEPTRLEIGDRNVIRECVTLHRGTAQDRGRHAHRRRQPLHGLRARRPRLRHRQPVRPRQHMRRSPDTCSSATG